MSSYLLDTTLALGIWPAKVGGFPPEKQTPFFLIPCEVIDGLNAKCEGSRFTLPEPSRKLRHAHERPSHRPSPDFLRTIAGRNPHRVKPSIEGFHHRLRFDLCADSAGRPMFHMNRRPHRDFITLAVGLEMPLSP